MQSTKLQVICLTATADDGYKNGAEHKALVALDFSIFHNMKEIKYKPAKISERCDLDDDEKVIKTVMGIA